VNVELHLRWQILTKTFKAVIVAVAAVLTLSTLGDMTQIGQFLDKHF
jgi:hypothetical protein